MKRDHDHATIVDFLIAGMYRIYLLLHDKQWQEAFTQVYTNLTVVERFNEFLVYSKHTFMLSQLLQKMDLKEQAMQVLDFLRDFVEDTNLNKEAILVYEEIGRINQEDKDYHMALKAYKRMLQIAWFEND